MKDYIWIIIAGVFALIAFFFFVTTISKSGSLISKLKLSKLNIGINVLVLLIGAGNIAIALYLLQDVKRQIELFTSF